MQVLLRTLRTCFRAWLSPTVRTPNGQTFALFRAEAGVSWAYRHECGLCPGGRELWVSSSGAHHGPLKSLGFQLWSFRPAGPGQGPERCKARRSPAGDRISVATRGEVYARPRYDLHASVFRLRHSPRAPFWYHFIRIYVIVIGHYRNDGSNFTSSMIGNTCIVHDSVRKKCSRNASAFHIPWLETLVRDTPYGGGGAG